jgi:hypothetical protein
LIAREDRLPNPVSNIFDNGSFNIIDSFVLSNRIQVCWNPEIEKSLIRHLWISEDAVQDLKLGNRFAFIFIQPFILFNDRLLYFVIYPAISLAKNADEIRSTVFYFSKADRENFAFSALCSSVMPQRRSTSPQVTPLSSQSFLNWGKILLTSSSRSACMSLKVEETKTLILRSFTSISFPPIWFKTVTWEAEQLIF